METLKTGTRFFYTGDQANGSTFGTITEVIKGQFGTYYKAEYDEETYEGDTRIHKIEKFSFEGKFARFITVEKYNSDRIKQLTSLGYKESDIELAK